MRIDFNLFLHIIDHLYNVHPPKWIFSLMYYCTCNLTYKRCCSDDPSTYRISTNWIIDHLTFRSSIFSQTCCRRLSWNSGQWANLALATARIPLPASLLPACYILSELTETLIYVQTIHYVWSAAIYSSYA